jgi:hydrogenase/urease accessory protein HupE
MVLAETRPPLWVAALIVGFFAVFHGHAHGTELPAGQSGLLYSAGFVIATGCLHSVGITIGLLHRWAGGRVAIRAAGGMVALAGVYFLWSSLEWATGLSLLIAGALVAADRDLPLSAIVMPAAIIGFIQGLLTGSALASAPSGALELLGTVAALIVPVTLEAGLVMSLRVFWVRIIVRVIGSWIAAIGLLMIGWAFRSAHS